MQCNCVSGAGLGDNQSISTVVVRSYPGCARTDIAVNKLGSWPGLHFNPLLQGCRFKDGEGGLLEKTPPLRAYTTKELTSIFLHPKHTHR